MKNSKVIRMMCAVIAMLMLLCTFVACADNGDDKPADTTPAPDGAVTTPADIGAEVTEPEDALAKDDVPEDVRFDGKTITILYWEDQEHEEFFVEEQTGDIVADGIFDRNAIVEDRLGITMDFVSHLGNSQNVASWTNYVQTSIQAGGGEFDVIGGYSLSQASCASKSLFYDLMDPGCEYLNFDQPWWPDSLINEATINNKLLFASGDISANALYMMYVVFVNNSILEDLSLPNVYELVDTNKWTFDTFFTMCNNVYIDQDGSGDKTVGDRFGHITCYLHSDPWFYASGALIADKDANGNLQLSDTFGSERTVKSLEMLTNFLYNTDDGLYTEDSMNREFNNGNVLFISDRCRISITMFDNLELSYSVVPFPKFDEAQENYVTCMGNPFTLYSLPIDSTDDELPMLSAFLEVYASESYRNVTPALFETSLKIKYSQDNAATRMYDIIRETLCFDLGRIFSSVLIGQSHWNMAIEDNATTWAGTAKQLKKPMANKIKALMKAYE